MKSAEPTELSLVRPDGRIQFGHFPDALPLIDLSNYRHRTSRGGTHNGFARWFSLKQFEYFGVLSEQLLFGCAIAHLRTATMVFLYVYLPGQGENKGMVVEKTIRYPLGFLTTRSKSPISGDSQAGRRPTVQMGYADNPRGKSIRVDLGDTLKVNASFDEQAAGFEPMSLCTRIGRNGWVYAHKVAGVPVTGSVEVGGKTIDLSAINAHAHHDYSVGYMRRKTFWNWACFSGLSADGQPIGLNVSCGVNETSFSENCYWLDGKLYPLGLCHFEYDWDEPMKPWLITTNDGRLNLNFVPEGAHLEKMNFGLLGGDFKQIFGRFEGEIAKPSGEKVIVKNLYGFVEDQYAKW